ncbi:M56 family metallopeptidase [Streptomyces lydicus]|uniref:M56 family metallopeptidase n=1 Tax=Streptomyces lydicus TaxID=47763 RepID=UPI0005242CFE|nr:M56 family metallopeptidase [Streptomyces lydicus]MDC7340839.1 M56 family metallopeptidase [Streptomyces lydicus]UEG89463.1 M56 family metallopeptidase [Streptomyces lydicus]
MSSAPAGAAVGMPHPFRMPSGTSLRFALLILSTSTAMATTLGGAVGTASYFGLGGDIDDIAGTLTCAAATIHDTATDPDKFASTCPQPSLGNQTALGLAALGALWLAVGIVYWLLPAYRIRRRRLRPLPTTGLADLRRTLDELVAVAGLRCRVRFVVDWRQRAPSGLAFGRVGRRHVMLSAGLLQLHRRDPEAFRAIVLHELAHLRNRDVDIAFLTIICYRLFVVAVAIPLAVSAPFALLVAWLLLPSSLLFQLQFILAMCALAATVALTSSAVLRSRELYADARVAVWTRGAPSLRRLLAAQCGRERTGRRRSPLLRPHPPAAKRLAALSDPRLLFAFGPWEAFGLALTCSLVYQQMSQWTEEAARLTDEGSPLSAVAPSVVLGGGVAMGIWHAVLAARLNRGRWEDAHRTGLATAAGLIVGTFGDKMHGTALSLGVADALPVQLSWWLILGAVGYGFVRWNAATARVWAPVVLAGRRPLLLVGGGCAVGVALLSICLGHAYAAGAPGFQLLPLPRPLNLLPTPLDYLGFVFSTAFVLTPPQWVIALVVVAVGFPLAARLGVRLSGQRRAGASTAGPERFLLQAVSAEDSAALLDPPQVRPLKALAQGAVFGAAAGLGLWLWHLFCALVFPRPIEWVGAVFTFYQLALAALLQLAVGFVVAWRHARGELRALHGILGALGAGLLLPLAAITARDHFACMRWGTGHAACRVTPDVAFAVSATPTITAWTTALALLFIPAWTALRDRRLRLGIVRPIACGEHGRRPPLGR